MRQPFSILLFPFCFKAVPSDLIQQVQRLWQCRKHWQTLDLGLESTSCNCSWIMIVRNLHPTNANYSESEKLKCIVGHVKFSWSSRYMLAQCCMCL